MILHDKLSDIFINTKKEVVISYQGPFNIDILVVLGNNIKRLTSQSNNASRRLHKIFVELAQNIASYSAENIQLEGNTIGVGTIILEDHAKYYTFTSKNLVKNNDGQILNERCLIINSLDRQGLRNLKREKRQNSEKIKLSAHIGLIHAALLSENLLDFSLEQIDSKYSYFGMTVKVEKN